MGEISRQLHGKLKAVSSGNPLLTNYDGRKPIPGTPDIAKLIAEGMDPIHATYIFIHHIASSLLIGEKVSQLPEMQTLKAGVDRRQAWTCTAKARVESTGGHAHCVDMHCVERGARRAPVGRPQGRKSWSAPRQITNAVHVHEYPCPRVPRVPPVAGGRRQREGTRIGVGGAVDLPEESAILLAK